MSVENTHLNFDVNSTTAIVPAAYAAMEPFLRSEFGNPSSAANPAGRRAKAALEAARAELAAFTAARPEEIVFTGGGTESIFAAVVGALRGSSRRRIVTSAVEHPAVSEAARFAAELLGAEVVTLPVSRNGELFLSDLEAAVSPDTALVSLMYANNETGVAFPIAEAATIAHRAGALMHTDAVQATGKERISFEALGVDLYSLSGHKFGASKGVGALIVREGAAWRPVMVGGGQERGRRGGTESVALIAGLGAAANTRRLALESGLADRVQALRDDFERQLAVIPGTVVNGGRAKRLGNTSSVSIAGILSTELIGRLEARGIAVSAGSACKAETVHASHVLLAMGLSIAECLGTIRVSFGPDHTAESVTVLLDALRAEIPPLREAAHEVLDSIRKKSHISEDGMKGKYS